MGSLTEVDGPLSFLAPSSSGFIRHDVRAVAIMDESRKDVDFIILAYFCRIAAVRAVAAFPLFPASCLLIIMRAVRGAYSSSVYLIRQGSSVPFS
jgi:hypothetical protein